MSERIVRAWGQTGSNGIVIFSGKLRMFFILLFGTIVASIRTMLTQYRKENVPYLGLLTIDRWKIIQHQSIIQFQSGNWRKQKETEIISNTWSSQETFFEFMPSIENDSNQMIVVLFGA